MKKKLTSMPLTKTVMFFLLAQQAFGSGDFRIDIHGREMFKDFSQQVRLSISTSQNDPDGGREYTEHYNSLCDTERPITFNPMLRFYHEHSGPNYSHTVSFTFQLTDFDGNPLSTSCYHDLTWIGYNLESEQMTINITAAPQKQKCNFYGFLIQATLPFSLQGPLK